VSERVPTEQSKCGLLTAYRPYLPAILTLGGAVFVAIGLFAGQGAQSGAVFQWLRFVGAAMAAIGAFWSGHRQVKAGADNRARDQKIIELSGRVYDQLTGGDSFCHGYPWFSTDGPTVFQWIFIHSGQFPLTDVSVRICNLDRTDGQMNLLGRTLALGTLFPGRAHHQGPTEVRLPSHGFNLFFLARNGSWTQEIRWVEQPTALLVANRVVRDGAALTQPLLKEISPEFPRRLPDEDAWNDPPPYISQTGASQ